MPNSSGATVQVFFDYREPVDLEPFKDTIVHAGQASVNPLAVLLLPRGLWPGARRYHRNYHNNRALWQKLLDHSFSRPEPAESNTAFWACIRRAYPNAMTDSEEKEGALVNIALMYGAGSETTVNAITAALALLATDAAATAALVQVRPSCDEGI